MKLREYQRKAIDDLYEWFRSGKEGNPCMVLPTGSGKSVIIAGLCKEAIQLWPATRILLLSHVKEIIQQDADKLRKVWPNAPLGVYSAGLGKRELGMPITFAGVQSVVKRAGQIGKIDLVIVDEAHRISHKNQGGYRRLIDDLEKINPSIRVIGLTATPYRLGHGRIDEGDAIFDGILGSVTIEDLVSQGYLCPLRSKLTDKKLDVKGVRKRGGEYVEKDLQKAVDKEDTNGFIAREICKYGEDRKSWLVFCTGVIHSNHMRDKLASLGVDARTITGKTPKLERQQTFDEFKKGNIRCLIGVSVFDTGFDAPNVDLIAMLRPTLSPVVYVQQAGRGMRIIDGKKDCIVLDFAGNVQKHGPITRVEPPSKKGEGGEAPVKTCPKCLEIVHASLLECPSCFYVFPIRAEKEQPKLHHDDIMGWEASEMTVKCWEWEVHKSKRSGKEMLKCRYYGGLSDPVVKEYVTLMHDGYAGRKALKTITDISSMCGVNLYSFGADSSLEDLANALNDSRSPSSIEYRMDGRFYRIISRNWN